MTDDNPFDDAYACDDVCALLEAREGVQRIYNLLTPAQGDLAKKLMDGWTQAEIAGCIGVQQPAISMRIMRMRRRLGRKEAI